MIFNSLTFIIFFAVVLVLYYLPYPWGLKKLMLVIASFLFYAAWNPPFVILLWITIIFDFMIAKLMGNAQDPKRRKFLMVVDLIISLSLLGYFKYGNFLMDSFIPIMKSLGVIYAPPRLDIILPVGISFYTFHSLSYTIEVYRGTMKPWRSFLDYALFVSFFPPLVAGPIVRAEAFLPQTSTPRRATSQQMGWGLALLVIGLFQKIVLADGMMAFVANSVYTDWMRAGFAASWLGTLAFSAQIFFDFAGYSLCAIGAALCLGFVLKDNFNHPYGAIGFSDFWKRWHISLSTWLRDYVYISLGGNRKGEARTYINLMLTMLIGGLWHGASWMFVVWGGLHGAYLVAERFISSLRFDKSLAQTLPVKILLGLLTYFLVCITWVMFRAGSFDAALHMLQAMVFFKSPAVVMDLRSADIVMVLGLNALMLIVHALMRHTTLEHVAAKMPWYVKAVLLALMLIAILKAPGERNAFIYFQF